MSHAATFYVRCRDISFDVPHLRLEIDAFVESVCICVRVQVAFFRKTIQSVTRCYSYNSRLCKRLTGLAAGALSAISWEEYCVGTNGIAFIDKVHMETHVLSIQLILRLTFTF
jgi:hypothetical protein